MASIGDTVRVFGKSYVRGTRRPGFNGRFTYRFMGEGVLLAKTDKRGHEHTSLANWSEEQLAEHFRTHLGCVNATGGKLQGDLTERNNPVLINGRVIWVGSDQINRRGR